MSSPSSISRYVLRPDVRLLTDGRGGGTLLQASPLRALRLNPAAFALLQRCRDGVSAEGVFEEMTKAGAAGDAAQAVRSFLEGLCRANIVDWEPPEEGHELSVTVVVPVYNRAAELEECLQSLGALDYPADRLQIIVVDDGSTDESAAVARRHGAEAIVLPANRGQSAARNAGVEAASGEIVAFIDSDCMADPRWLRELAGFFLDSRVAAVGGYVESCYRESRLDRYEAAMSPLNMGERRVAGEGGESDFYVPTCNLLVRRSAYREAGGLDEDLRVGEDVDLCWRLKARGHRLWYVPRGRVRHRHRNRFPAAFRRRFDYGTSEPLLFRLHPEVSKRFPRLPGASAAMGLCALGLLTNWLAGLALAALVLTVEALLAGRRIGRKVDPRPGFGAVLAATGRTHVRFAYFVTYHLVRYYLMVWVVLAAALPWARPLAAALLLFPALVMYINKRPRLSPLWFLGFFWLEQIFYQAGVFWGSIKIRNFGCYRVSLVSRDVLRVSAAGGSRAKNPAAPGGNAA